MDSAHQETQAEHAAEVTVECSGCKPEDAQAIFTALRTSFASDRSADDAPRETAGGGPSVWTATFDVNQSRDTPGPTQLTAPCTVTLQGGYQAVDQLRKALLPAFVVSVVGTAAGDQEEEVQLRLESR
ncbi:MULTISPECIES: hypothetical protein [Streptomyces]|uniref:Uncharacterized protein n=1 Tax=Streptomyces olivaceiscleroticus TaxID=68245 RepID=A0ABN1AS72_9ACTN|nr:hypothetical protein [Streptomyces niger]